MNEGIASLRITKNLKNKSGQPENILKKKKKNLSCRKKIIIIIIKENVMKKLILFH